MRISRAGRGAAGAAALNSPGAGMRRLVDAVSSVFAPRDTVEFTPVDGVYRLDNDASGQRSPKRRIEASTRIEAHRLYNARAGTDYVYTGPKGLRVDVVA